jgi:hypothetical protein
MEMHQGSASVEQVTNQATTDDTHDSSNWDGFTVSSKGNLFKRTRCQSHIHSSGKKE